VRAQQIELLEHESDLRVPDPRQGVRRQAGHVLAVELVAARARRVEAPEQVHEGRLARARGAHDRHEIAAFDRHGHAAQGVNGVGTEMVVLRQPLGDDDRLGHG